MLVLVAAALVVSRGGKARPIRKRRYLTRDPRKLARACVRELSDFVSDQGAKAPPSATLGELAKLVEAELGVSASSFVSAAAEARFRAGYGGRRAARSQGASCVAAPGAAQALTPHRRALGSSRSARFGLTGYGSDRDGRRRGPAAPPGHGNTAEADPADRRAARRRDGAGELRAAGCDRATVVTGYLASQVEACGDGSGFGVELRYARQPRPDGSADAVSRGLAAGAEAPLLVATADTVFRPGDLARFAARFR